MKTPTFGYPNTGNNPLPILEVQGEKTGHIVINDLKAGDVNIFFINGIKFVRTTN
tara:strand:- start:145 stop:309 length:165 start_codon:yes stop_codon:yes gene_type:complete